jgi:hypothetical protein
VSLCVFSVPLPGITVIFFSFNVLPGDPARMMLDQNEKFRATGID